MKNKKVLKIGAFILAMLLILALVVFAGSFLGNPFAKNRARKTAEKYISDNLADTDFYIEDVKFSFKDGKYYAHIKEDNSLDKHFELIISMNGEIKYDTFDNIENKSNTAHRLGYEYRKLTDSVTDNEKFPYKDEIVFGDLLIKKEEYWVEDVFAQYTLKQESLETDKEYDIYELGSKYGMIIVNIETDEVSIEKAAEIMLSIKEMFDKNRIPFKIMEFSLRTPFDEKGNSTSIDTLAFEYDDIDKDGLIERIKEADRQAKIYYNKLDELKNNE